jgi:hypothetical protein
MAKRKVAKKADKGDSCEMNGHCHCGGCAMKISAMAFILFLVTVWPAVGNWLIGVPWWVYLIIMVVFGGAGCGMKGHCWCCKK